ncbi:LysR family transcriptional regulator [Vibrio sp. FNV 38]|nr:LysR family transcriptional regulator [Vibrio sp. FNV 38]
MMNFKHLHSFLLVAQHGNFSTAAQELHTVQSAISRHINALESDLQVTLFTRNTRHVALTASGEVFLQHVQKIFQLCEHAKQDTWLVDHGKKGLLRIGYLSSVCSHFLPSMLKAFTSCFPNVDLDVIEMTASEQEHALVQGAIDVGFSRPLSGQQTTFINTMQLESDCLTLVVADNHALTQKKFVDLHQVANFPLILFSRNHAPSLFDTIISTFHNEKLQPNITNEPNSMQALLTLVASTNKVALVPNNICYLQTQGCQFIKLKSEIPILLEMHWPEKASLVTQTWVTWFTQKQTG